MGFQILNGNTLYEQDGEQNSLSFPAEYIVVQSSGSAPPEWSRRGYGEEVPAGAIQEGATCTVSLTPWARRSVLAGALFCLILFLSGGEQAANELFPHQSLQAPSHWGTGLVRPNQVSQGGMSHVVRLMWRPVSLKA